MNATRLLRWSLAAVCASVIAAGVVAHAQQAAQQYQPQVGQPGKDVVWVPTAQTLVDKMLDMAKVTPQDYVIDLGSGDGRTVITAVKRGARALGIEYNPDMVELSKANAAKEGVGSKATFLNADLFETDFSEATVITMFLLPDVNLKLRPRILNLKAGTRIVSNSFRMEDWMPDQEETVTDRCETWCTALLWIVPAQVQGTWQLANGAVTLTQSFQMISGNVQSGATTEAIAEGRLRGADISFTAKGASYSGHVNDRVMEGTFTSAAGTGSWKATRQEK